MGFDIEFLNRLDKLLINTRSMVKGGTGGIRRSSSKGSSVEFSDFREYTLGDDFRHIDWNAYARFDRLFIKLFMEEQEAIVNLFIDCSKSMDWGQPNKAKLSKELLAVFAYIALSSLDRLSITSLKGHRANSLMKPISGKQNFFKVLKMIDELSFEGGTHLSASIRQFPLPNVRGGISIILTDLFSKDGYEDAIKYLKYNKQDVILIHILSPEELDPQLDGSLRLIDVEDGQHIDLNINQSLLKKYKANLEKFMNDNQKFCFQNGVYYIPVSSALSIEQIVYDNLFRLGIIK